MVPSFKASFLVPVRNAANTLALFLTIPLASSVALAESPISKQTPDDRRAADDCSAGSAPVAMAWTARAVQVLA